MEDLIGAWRHAWAEWTAAEAAGKPVGVRNRIMDRIWALGREIAASAEMHEAVSALCSPGQDPELRVRAALVLEHWDAVAAANTFVSVIEDSGVSITRPVTMASALDVESTTAATAALCLLNIDEGRGNTGSRP